MKRFLVGLSVALSLLWLAPAAAQTSGTTKVVGTCGTAVYTAGKPNYPTQDTTGLACSSATISGSVTATTTATASATPTAVVAGTGKPLNEGLFSNLFITPVTPGGTQVDLSAPSGVLGVDGATIATLANPFPTSASLVAGAAIVGKVGIDQTTDGTTNAVHLVASTAVVGHVINDASSAVIGHVIADTGSTTAATQATAANLNATVVGTGTFATQAAQSGTWTVQPGNTANTTAWKVDGSAVTQPVSVASLPALPANQSVNVAQVNGVTPLMGNGVTGTGSPRVTVASDNTPFAVKIDQTTLGTTNATAIKDKNNVAPDFTLTAPTAQVGPYPSLNTAGVVSSATPETCSSGNVANATVACTLATAAGKTTYITGFNMTADGSTAGLAVSCTLTGTITGTMTYTFGYPTGALAQAAPLNVQFPYPVPASATNTTIVVSCPASGTGGTNASISATGFQL